MSTVPEVLCLKEIESAMHCSTCQLLKYFKTVGGQSWLSQLCKWAKSYTFYFEDQCCWRLWRFGNGNRFLCPEASFPPGCSRRNVLKCWWALSSYKSNCVGWSKQSMPSVGDFLFRELEQKFKGKLVLCFMKLFFSGVFRRYLKSGSHLRTMESLVQIPLCRRNYH